MPNDERFAGGVDNLVYLARDGGVGGVGAGRVQASVRAAGTSSGSDYSSEMDVRIAWGFASATQARSRALDDATAHV